jgi:type IV pilus assembly protein PilM
MAAHQMGVWGIDVGQCALKAIRLEQKDGEVVATAFEYIEHPKILSQPDADPDQLTREALEQFLSRNNIRGDMVVISVPGQSGLARFVKLPPVEEKKIADIVRFEAKQQIPFPLEEVVWDFQKLSSGNLDGGDYVETEIGLFAMKRDLVNRALQQFKDAGVEVHIVQMAPLALCNYIAYDLLGQELAEGEEKPEGKACVVALDVGTDNSNLVITDGDKIIWQRPIPLGGNHFTRALTKDLKLTFAKAEHLKRNAAKSPELKKILASLKSVLNDFVGEVQRSLGYFTNTHRDATIQYMVGLGNACRLPGLQKFLQEKLQLEVRKMTGLVRTGGEEVTAAPTFTENIMGFAVAYGLALQGLKLTRLQTNLLPGDVRLERLIRAKKPWALTAAACLLLAVAGLAFSKGIEKAAVTKPAIKMETDRGRGLLKKNGEKVKAFEDEVQKQVEAINAVNRIGAGVKERFNWQMLQEYINMSLPLPNGERLTVESSKSDPVKEKYWDKKKEAKQAFLQLESLRYKQANEVPAEMQKKQEKFIKENLIQVNIEGISALYSDDLGPYYRKIAEFAGNLFGMFKQDSDLVKAYISTGAFPEALPKAGWVVEIRGYTYHWGKLEFIENTIVENLKFPEQLKGPDNKPVVLAPEMKKQISDRLSHLFILLAEPVPNPEPGKFVYIGRSLLPDFVKGSGGAGGGMPAPGDAPRGADAADAGGGAKANNRDSWNPLGEIASTGGAAAGGGSAATNMFKGAGAPGAGGPGEKVRRGGAQPPTPVKEGPTEGPTQAQPRTEFVIFFVWRELLSTEAPPSAPVVAAPVVEKN